MLDYNKIINNILNYEEPKKLDEIYECLLQMKYVLGDIDISKFDLMLDLLVENDYDVYLIIKKHEDIDLSLIDKSVKTIMSKSLLSTKNDLFLKKYKDKITNEQINLLVVKIKEMVSSSTFYDGNRVNDLVLIFEDNILTDIFNEYLKNENLNDNNKFNDLNSLAIKYRDKLDNEILNNFLSSIIDSNQEKRKIISIIENFKDIINIENIKKLPPYFASIMDYEIYDKLFSIYNYNLSVIIEDDIMNEYYNEFLTEDLKYTKKIKRSLNLLTKTFNKLHNLSKFILSFVENDNINDLDNVVFINTINYYYAKEPLENKEKIFFDIIGVKIFDSNELSKIIEIFNEIYLDIEVDFDNENETTLLNLLQIYLMNKKTSKVDIYLNSIKDETLIIKSFELIAESTLKFSRSISKYDFNKTLVNIFEETNCEEIKRMIRIIQNKYQLLKKEKKDLVR